MRGSVPFIGALLISGALTSGCAEHPASPAEALENDLPQLAAAAANAATMQSSDVYTWPPPGDLVDGATATLLRRDNGVSLTWRSLVADPGAYTLWWVIFNPGACAEPGACGVGDLFVDGDPALGPNPLVAVMIATGNVVGNSGRANFGAHLNVSGITGSVHPFFPDSPGLLDARNAEIHVVLQDHGEMLPGSMPAQIHEFHGGCPPNECEDLQFAMFKPDTDATPDHAGLSMDEVRPIVPDLTGTWKGLVSFGGGDVQLVQPPAFDAKVEAQKGRRVTGKKTFGGNDFKFSGTYSENGQLNLIGEGVGTSPGGSQGIYRSLKLEGGAGALLGAVQVRSDGHEAVGGHILVRKFDFDEAAGGDPPPDVSGSWTAEFESDAGTTRADRAVVLVRDPDAPTRLHGTLELGYAEILLEGTIDAEGNMLMVALSMGVIPCYIVVLQGEFTPGTHSGDDVGPIIEPGQFQGEYFVLEAVSPNMLISPNMVVQEAGTFVIVEEF